MAATPESSSASALSERLRAQPTASRARPPPRYPTSRPPAAIVEYVSEPDPAAAANRMALLRAAARFSRVFQLSAPEAPGLVFFGAEVARA